MCEMDDKISKINSMRDNFGRLIEPFKTDNPIIENKVTITWDGFSPIEQAQLREIIREEIERALSKQAQPAAASKPGGA